MTYRANWFWQIKVTTVTSCLTGSKAVVELPLYQAGVQPGIRERLIGMFIKNAISLKIYFSNSKIIAVSLPGMKRRLSIFMPLFHLPVFWFGYFDGFKTGSSLIKDLRIWRVLGFSLCTCVYRLRTYVHSKKAKCSHIHDFGCSQNGNSHFNFVNQNSSVKSRDFGSDQFGHSRFKGVTNGYAL